MKEEKKQINVAALENGTVIDHIQSDETFKVVDILNLQHEKNLVIVAVNLPSRKMGIKGLIKVSQKTLSKEEFNKIAIISPDATISIIKHYHVKEKVKVSVPDSIEGVIRCSNPNCITNHEQVLQRFKVTSKAPLRVMCTFCERWMEKKEIRLM